MTGPNTLLLKKFPDASYIICVTLLSSSDSTDHPPISTSDMCIDLVVGELHPVGGHHSSTGLLSPLLLAVAAVLLAIIIICHYVKDAFAERRKRRKDQKQQQQRKKSLQEGLSGVGGAGLAEKEEAATIKKSLTEQRFEEIIKKPEEPEWQTAAKKTQIVANDSVAYDLGAQRRASYYYENEALERDFDHDYDANQYRNEHIYNPNQQYLHHYHNQPYHHQHRKSLNSWETVNHLLQDKPWLSKPYPK